MDEHRDSEKKEFHFLNETIKDPDAKKQLIKRVIRVLILAAAAGAVAAFVFALVRPAAEHLVSGKKKETVDIAMTADSSSVSSVSADSAASDSQETGSGPEGESGSAIGSSTQHAGEDADQDFVLDQYQLARTEINNLVVGVEKSIVEVTGIRSEMDYFNNSYENSSAASGVIIASDDTSYYILTESSVTDGAEQIRVSFFNGEEEDAENIRADSATGFAVIRAPKSEDTSATGPAVATLGNSYAMSRGESVVALGNPMGYESSYSIGAITSNTNTVSVPDRSYHILTTDIKGTSGGSGVLMNLEGEIIGIIDQSIGGEDSSIVKAIGVSELSDLMEKLTNNESRPYAGIRGDNVTKTISEKTGIPEGVLVEEVVQDSPAMLAGIKQQDVITKIGDESVTTVSEYTAALQEFSPGELMHVTAMRKGAAGYEEVTFDVTVGEC